MATRAGTALRSNAWTIGLVLVLVACTWPFASGPLVAGPGLDNSWVVGLSMATAHGLAFGRQVIFTYGPLGFALNPVAVTPGMLLAGEGIGGLLQVALVAVLLANLRRRMSWPLAIVLTIVGAVLTEPLIATAFGLVALALTTPAPRRAQAIRMLALGGGAFAGFALLVKLNDGVAVTAIVTAGLLGSDRRRHALAAGASSLLVALLSLWLLLGQPLGALPDYLHNGYDVVSGYVEAMGHNELGAGGDWEVLVLLGSAAALSTGAWTALSTEPLRRRAALAGAVLLVHYFLAREMFVRYDLGHAAFLGMLVAVALMIPWRRNQRAVGLALAGALAVASFSVLLQPIDQALDPLWHVNELVAQARDVVHPAALIAEGRTGVRRDDAVTATMARTLRGHCVNAEPDEIAAVWAHPGWRWCPLPVFQSYTAYTPRLDDLNAAAYAETRHGPDRVLRQVQQAIDGRNPAWESPAAMLSLLCHFTEIEHSESWQILARVPDRCGTPRTIDVIHSSLGHTITLPNPPEGTVMVASIDGLQVAGWERLETLLTRAAPRYVRINETTYRVPPGTADDGLVIAVPADADYPAPFNLNMDPHTLRATVDGHSSGAITVSLSAIPIAHLPAPPRAPTGASAAAAPAASQTSAASPASRTSAARASAASQSFRPDLHRLPWVYVDGRLLAPKQILSLPEEARERADIALLNVETLPLELPSAGELRAAVPAIPIRSTPGMRVERTPIKGTAHGCTLLRPSAPGEAAAVSVASGRGLYLAMPATGQVAIYAHRYARHVPTKPLHLLPTAGTPAVMRFPPDAGTRPWHVRLVPTTPTAVCLV
jgi:hypothetical protein